jgi:hypothetical protein
LLVFSAGRLYCFDEEDTDTTLWENDSDIEQAFQDGDIDYDTYENLLNVYDDKIDINSADVFQLQSLPGLTSIEAARIVNYRLQHGYYKTTLDLVNPEVIDDVTYDKIKIFVTVELPGKIKTRGDIILKTKSNTEVEMDTTKYPRTYDLFRLRVRKLGNYMNFGGIIEGDARYENYYRSGPYVTGGEINRSYRLNKSYLGYENGPVITQAYIGNYRAGFGQRLTFDNSGQSSPAGLYPDNTYSQQTKFTFYELSSHGIAEKDKFALGYTGTYLNGFGARVKQGKLDFTGFYSRAKYPLKSYIQMYTASDGTINTKSLYLEDMVEETLVGSNLTYKVAEKKGDLEESYIGTTLYTSKRVGFDNTEADIWRWPPQQTFAVYGTNFVTGYKGFNFVGEIAKVHGWGKAWYLKMFRKMGILDVIYSHRDYDMDFYNPWAKGESKHTDSAKFKCRDEQGDNVQLISKLSRTMRLQFALDQFRHTAKSKYDSTTQSYYSVYETPTIDKQIGIKYNWRLPRGVNLQIDRTWKDLDIYQNVDSADKMTVNSNIRIGFKPSKVCDFAVKYHYGEDYYDTPTKYIPKDYMLAQASYDMTANLQVSGQMKFSDTNLLKAGSGESRQYWLQLTDRLSREAKIAFRFTNKYSYSTDEYNTVDYYSLTEPGYTNKWEVRLDYKW